MSHDPTTFGRKRSSKWRKVRAKHLKKHPKCAVCGVKTKNQVHHVFPVHYFPEKELLMSNLITLCTRRNHHLEFGHLFSYRSWNKNVIIDARIWNKKIKQRS